MLLSYYLFYYQTVKELKTLKEYVYNHLKKGFIKHSLVPFALLILFVKKPLGVLWVYINYHKLNKIIRKDYYLLPLLDKTLACVSQAKVFTKLDIC